MSIYVQRHRVYIFPPEILDANNCIPSYYQNILEYEANFDDYLHSREFPKVSTFLLYLLIHNFISHVQHIYKPFLNICYPINIVYRSDQYECNGITDLALNIHHTISVQPLSLYLYGVDRRAQMVSIVVSWF